MAEQTVLIGRRIAQARDEARLTQAELAAEIPGKSDGTQVSKWERGIHRPSDDTLEHIARVLGHDVAWFMVPESQRGETPDPFSLDEPDLATIASAISGLDEQVRLLRAELAARDVEVLRRLDEGLGTS